MALISLTRGAVTLRGLAQGPVLSTLIFHRVLAKADPLFPGEPDAERFAKLMELVASAFRVITLSEALRGLATGNLPSRAMVITFDDGYADNAELALPIMKRVGVPGTFFVATGFLDGGRMWNDSVIECLRRSAEREIDLEFLGLGRMRLGSDSERRGAIEAVLASIKYLGLGAREQAIGQLRKVARVDGLPDNLMMTSGQVKALYDAGMEIGGHTVNHPILKSLSVTDAEREIVQGRARLEAIIGATVEVFAYPNGRPGRDYGPEHVDMVRRLGFLGAVSTAAGVAASGDDLHQVPRYTPWGGSLAVWSARLFNNLGKRDFLRV